MVGKLLSCDVIFECVGMIEGGELQKWLK